MEKRGNFSLVKNIWRWRMINCYAVTVFILFQIRAVGDSQQINYSPSNMKICFLCCLNLPVLIPDEGLGVGLGWWWGGGGGCGG